MPQTIKDLLKEIEELARDIQRDCKIMQEISQGNLANALGTENSLERCRCAECDNPVLCEHDKSEPHIAVKGCSICHQEFHPTEEEPF